MKVKVTITLSKDLLEIVDKYAMQYRNRSEFIETALRTFIAQSKREAVNARDLKIINQHANRLNEEAIDVLAYQSNL
ncbi:MAG: ribbon-helix-helix protein, CopG family [Chloroflexi bacterium]|nr:ribbon-helix-helix protein, CopG family [Chloroflexota bacterium]